MGQSKIVATYVRHGSKVKCPKCQSTSVKSFRSQPRKYPVPKPEELTTVTMEAAMKIYNNAFSCNRCSNEFYAVFESELPVKKPSLFFKLIKIFFILIIVFFMLFLVLAIWGATQS